MTSSSQRVHVETASLHSSSGFWPLTSWYTPARVAKGSEDKVVEAGHGIKQQGLKLKVQN